jgi:hypothetical protein
MAPTSLTVCPASAAPLPRVRNAAVSNEYVHEVHDVLPRYRISPEANVTQPERELEIPTGEDALPDPYAFTTRQAASLSRRAEGFLAS